MGFKISRETRDALKFLSPFFAFLAVFIIYPMVASLYFTLNDLKLSDLKPVFTGLGNWIHLPFDPLFQLSLIHTLVYVGLHTAIGIPLGLGLALLLGQEFKGVNVARVCLLIPWATPPIVAALMFSIIFNPYFGTVIYTFEQMRLLPHQFSIFGTPSTALFGLVLVSMWKSAPLFAFIFLSGMQTLPTEVLESAKVYGASGFMVFRKIILPHLKPIFAVNCILSFLLAMSGTQAFDIVIGLTNGGPGYETYMLYFYAYLLAFPWNNLGYGATVAWVVTLIALVLAYTLLRLWYKRVY